MTDGADRISFRSGRVVVEPRARRVTTPAGSVRISGRAFDLLVALIERRDRLTSKQELMDLLWPGLVVEENNLQVHVWSLRKLLGADAIVTVSGRATDSCSIPIRRSPPRSSLPDIVRVTWRKFTAGRWSGVTTLWATRSRSSPFRSLDS